jgi:hypothetical protein
MRNFTDPTNDPVFLDLAARMLAFSVRYPDGREVLRTWLECLEEEADTYSESEPYPGKSRPRLRLVERDSVLHESGKGTPVKFS